MWLASSPKEKLNGSGSFEVAELLALPSDKEAERQLVSSLMAEYYLFDQAKDLESFHFLDTEARAHFAEMKRMHLNDREWRAEDFPPGWYTTNMPLLQLAELVERVMEAHFYRTAQQQAQAVMKGVIKKDMGLVERAVKAIDLPALRSAPYETFQEGLEDVRKLIGRERVHYNTGFTDLDNSAMLEIGYLNVLAARPGVGKSQLAAQCAANVAAENPDKTVVFWSGEMSSNMLRRRIIQSRAAASFIPSGDSESAIKRLNSEVDSMRDILRNLIIIASPISSTTLFAQCRHIQETQDPIVLIVSDHLRLFEDRGEAERHRLGNISKNHLWMAREFNCPVLLLAQLNRGVESRQGKERMPKLSDLRDSGEIEENTDKVTFIYREAYHELDPGQDRSGTALVYEKKNRDGPLSFSSLYWNEKAGPRFETKRAGHEEPQKPMWQDDKEVPF